MWRSGRDGHCVEGWEGWALCGGVGTVWRCERDGDSLVCHPVSPPSLHCHEKSKQEMQMMEQSLHSTWAEGQKEREEKLAASIQALQHVSTSE